MNKSTPLIISYDSFPNFHFHLLTFLPTWIYSTHLATRVRSHHCRWMNFSFRSSRSDRLLWHLWSILSRKGDFPLYSLNWALLFWFRFRLFAPLLSGSELGISFGKMPCKRKPFLCQNTCTSNVLGDRKPNSRKTNWVVCPNSHSEEAKSENQNGLHQNRRRSFTIKVKEDETVSQQGNKGHIEHQFMSLHFGNDKTADCRSDH